MFYREISFCQSQAKNQFPADTPNIFAIGLIVVVQVAIVKVHVQSVAGVIGISSGRPIVVGNGFLLLHLSFLQGPDSL